MPAMFVMMNAARSRRHAGLGIAETSYQSAVAYARDRLQGRFAHRPKNANGRPIRSSCIPTCAHAAPQKSFTRPPGAGAVGRHADRRAHSHPDKAKAPKAADDLVQIWKPPMPYASRRGTRPTQGSAYLNPRATIVCRDRLSEPRGREDAPSHLKQPIQAESATRSSAASRWPCRDGCGASSISMPTHSASARAAR